MLTIRRVGLSALVLTAARLVAQQPTLTITAPTAGVVVHTGETFTVTVEPKGGHFVGVALIPPSPIPWTLERTEPPFTFTFSIPKTMTPGLYPFVAGGKTDSQQQVNSNRLWVDIERLDQPISVELAANGPYHMRPGDDFPLDVFGTYKNGDRIVLNTSRQTTFVSEDPTVVAIHDYGVFVAMAEGTTVVVIRAGGKQFKVQVIVTKNKE